MTSIRLVVIMLGFSTAIAQDLASPLGGLTLREEILRRCFSLSPTREGTLVRIVARFEPSASAESQLVLTVTDSGTELTYQQLDTSLTLKLNSIGSETVEAIAQSVSVKRTSRSLEARETQRQLAQFWAALDRSPMRLRERIGVFQLDGTRYSIQVETSLGSISAVVSDEEAADTVTGETDIVRWMNSLRLSLR